jgi:hypothetical protein
MKVRKKQPYEIYWPFAATVERLKITSYWSMIGIYHDLHEDKLYEPASS